MTCKFCLKDRCIHVSPDEEQAGKMGPTGLKLPTQATRERSLFELTDLRELLCVLCSKVIPNGPNQTYERAHHAIKHVRAGDAIEDRRGLPEGAVRYFVKAKATA